jgi:rod shape-determining protein MreC
MYRRSTRQRIFLAALLAASATVVTLDFREHPGGPIRRISNVAVSVVAPLQDGLARIFKPVGNFLSGLGELPQLRAENAKLRSEVEQLKADQRRFPEVERENASLRALTGAKDWAAGRSLTAQVIGVGPSNHEWTIFVDKGSSDGVKTDMAVISPEGLVGRVVLAAGSYSKVLLIIDPNHAVGSRLVGSGETGVLSGQSQADLRFDFIGPDTKVDTGETVVTSGYDRGIYAPGIPLGRVTRVEASKDGLSKTAYVSPFVDFTKLDFVKVLLDSGPVVPNGK